MGKKQKRGQSTIPHKEAFMRMNYLFQASLAALSADPAHPELSRFYIHTMKSVSKRLVLRMDPNVKRMLCKSCDTLLIPGVTCTNRIRARREQHLVVRCLTCGAVKRFLSRREHQLWNENQANVEPIKFAPPPSEIPPPPAKAEPPPAKVEPPPTKVLPPPTKDVPLFADVVPPPAKVEPPPAEAEPSLATIPVRRD